MDDSSKKPEAGRVIRSLTLQHWNMLEFTNLLRKRCEIEERYIEELEKLRNAFLDRGLEEPIRELASPLLQLFDNEVRDRKATTYAILENLRKLPHRASPNDADKKDGMTALARYGPLIEHRKAFGEIHDAVRNKEHISSVQEWFKRGRRITHFLDLSRETLTSYALPDLEIQYRSVINCQHYESEKIQEWNRDALPILLEEYQKHAEDIKALMRDITIEYSTLTSSWNASCGTALKSIADISIVSFADSVHELYQKECESGVFDTQKYYNYAFGMRETIPLFGTRAGYMLAFDIVHCDKRIDLDSLAHTVYRPSDVFMLEEKLKSVAHNHKERLSLLSYHECCTAIALCFLLAPALIKVTDEDVNRHSGKFPRDKMRPFMKRWPPGADGFFEWLIKQDPIKGSQLASRYFCHRTDASQFMLHIFRKWDFLHDAPQPDGTYRKFVARKEKTG